MRHVFIFLFVFMLLLLLIIGRSFFGRNREEIYLKNDCRLGTALFGYFSGDGVIIFSTDYAIKSHKNIVYDHLE